MVAAERLGGAQPLIGIRRRHAHVDDGHIGMVGGDRPLQRIGICYRGHDVKAAAGEGLGEPVPHDGGVLGDHDAQARRHQALPGNSIVIVVGPP
jgi:hypothetical protein